MGSSLSPLIIKYEAILKRDPHSRVFAPLAEAYRKLGLGDKATALLKQGLRYNSDCIMGYVSLAACYADEGQEQAAYATLRPIVASNRDNLKLQRLFGRLCLKLNHEAEALDTYKHLLFINPKDEEAAQKIPELEKSQNPVVQRPAQKDPVQFNLSSLSGENWQQVDLQPEPPSRGEFDPSPVITYTLVDLYIQQGYLEKAREVLEKIGEIDRESRETARRLREIERLLATRSSSEEEKGHQNLMGLFDKATGGQSGREELESLLWSFNDAVKKRAQDVLRKADSSPHC